LKPRSREAPDSDVEGVNLDVTEKGEISGIEILDASKKFPLKSLFVCEYDADAITGSAA
jgi:uncharacterized protein YuzE